MCSESVCTRFRLQPTHSPSADELAGKFCEASGSVSKSNSNRTLRGVRLQFAAVGDESPPDAAPDWCRGIRVRGVEEGVDAIFAFSVGFGPKPLLRGDPPPFPRKGWFWRIHTISPHFPQHILTSFRNSQTQLWRPLRCVLCFVASGACGTIELRMSMPTIAAQVPQMSDQGLVRGQELRGFHDRKARS